MKCTREHRKRVKYYLDQFYKRMPQEKSTIFHFVKFFKQRHKNNKQTFMGLSGEAGAGKSYFVIMCQILYGRPYDLKKNIIYIPSANEISEKLSSFQFQTLLIDEAARSMRSASWQDKGQQKTTMLAQTERFRRNWVFMAIPNFNELTKSLRTGSMIFRTIVLYRTDTHARILLQRKSRNWRSDDPWGDKVANVKYDKATKKHSLDNKTVLSIERNLDSYVMDFAIPNLALIVPDLVEEYENLKISSRKVMENEEEKEKPNFHKKKYENLMIKMVRLLKYNEIEGKKFSQSKVCETLGVSVGTYKKFLGMELPEEIKQKNPRRKLDI